MSREPGNGIHTPSRLLEFKASQGSELAALSQLVLQGNHNSIMAYNYDEYFKGVAFLARAAGGDC